MQQCTCEEAQTWHTYATFALSNTERVSRTPRNILPKTRTCWRSENAFGLDVSSETLIFKMQQHVIENTKHGHGLLLQMQKQTNVAYVYHFGVFRDSHGMRLRAKILKTYGFSMFLTRTGVGKATPDGRTQTTPDGHTK